VGCLPGAFASPDGENPRGVFIDETEEDGVGNRRTKQRRMSRSTTAKLARIRENRSPGKCQPFRSQGTLSRVR